MKRIINIVEFVAGFFLYCEASRISANFFSKKHVLSL